ncbi:TPA: winged helix-turn-helix transcriptional regulator [Morganella morganii subsp. morganii]|uniref:MarR family transcriptional regulator n=2 Tax=Morganella morganii TaxID=582 RepID=A0AAU8ZTW0_MORMO|nr:MarR family transcriptional regulator [Morganella morganii]HDU8691204.1 winged helix-turn-helix transcriptional regulator [Morganella morganii subsp. morganii]EKW8485885.1 winged helix-turn-helix transcriptional regulator [Morganella morganii]EKW8488384.1 winged helix-turn-helix transcriptional regulator [Morganella morganii]HAT3623012.1 MarR family transcriptional regulator [Morganella morganii]
MSNSEWYILSRVYDQPVSIADISATVTISRQAIHKFIRQMEEKGLITIFDVQGSKKLKGVKMTPYGQQCYDAYEAIKTGLCDEIAAAVGQENLALIIRLFQQTWFDEKQ